jgi:hypothetical protein
VPADGFELEYAREHGRQLMQAVQQAQLAAHPRVQEPVLDGERDAIGDGPQLGRLGVLKGLVAASCEQQQPQRAIADQQTSPGEMARRVRVQPGGLGELVRRTDPDRALARGRLDRGQRERLDRQVSGRDPPAAGDLKTSVGVQDE